MAKGKAGGPQVPQHIQDELTRLGGTNPFGKPKLQLVHGSVATIWLDGALRLKYAKRRRVQVGWEGLVGEEMRFFPMSTPKDSLPLIVQKAFGDVEDPFPGWILESWVSPEKLAPHWEQNRWDVVPGQEKVDVLGELPKEGAYYHLWTCVDGDGFPLAATDRRIMQVVSECLRLIEERQLGGEEISEERALQQQRRREEEEAAEQQEVDAEFDDTVDGIFELHAKKDDGLQREWSLPASA